MTPRLSRELRLLYAAEAAYKVPAAPVARQLITDEDRPLPDVLPPRFRWLRFEWPESRVVDYTNYWREVDRKGRRWMGEYL